MRVLCLHGSGTNISIFKTQTDHIRYELERSGVEFEYLEGSQPMGPAPGILQTFPGMTEFFTWYDFLSAESIAQARDDLLDLLREEHFDGVLAFSEGAALASMAIIRFEKENPLSASSLFRFAIFISGAAPFDEERIESAMRATPGGKLDEPLPRATAPGLGTGSTTVMHLPTVHIVGRNDDWYGSGIVLSKLCDSSVMTCIVHDGGHEVPRNPPAVVARMKEAIATVIQKADMVQ